MSEQVIKTLNAQLNSHKQAVNEFLNVNLQLKTNINILQDMLQEANAKVEELTRRVAELEPVPSPVVDELDPA